MYGTTKLQEELEHRASEGRFPVTIKAVSERLAALGYRLDRSMDCRSFARYMTGPRAGASYPCLDTGINECDTGRRFCNVDARRDANFEALQALRLSGDCFAVTRGYIMDL